MQESRGFSVGQRSLSLASSAFFGGFQVWLAVEIKLVKRITWLHRGFFALSLSMRNPGFVKRGSAGQIGIFCRRNGSRVGPYV